MQAQEFPETDKGSHCEWAQQPGWCHQAAFLTSYCKTGDYYDRYDVQVEKVLKHLTKIIAQQSIKTRER